MTLHISLRNVHVALALLFAAWISLLAHGPYWLDLHRCTLTASWCSVKPNLILIFNQSTLSLHLCPLVCHRNARRLSVTCSRVGQLELFDLALWKCFLGIGSSVRFNWAWNKSEENVIHRERWGSHAPCMSYSACPKPSFFFHSLSVLGEQSLSRHSLPGFHLKIHSCQTKPKKGKHAF